MGIWYILWPFGIFFRFGMMYQEKSGNPASQNKRVVSRKPSYLSYQNCVAQTSRLEQLFLACKQCQ
jgi:hypothetical protein